MREVCSRRGDDPDPKVCPQLLQKDESEHGLRDQADGSRNKTLRRGGEGAMVNPCLAIGKHRTHEQTSGGTEKFG